MPRYLVERTFANARALARLRPDAEAQRALLVNNALEAVTWLYSYVVPERCRSLCVYEAPTPEAVRRAAQRNGLPVDRITEVQWLAPGLDTEGEAPLTAGGAA